MLIQHPALKSSVLALVLTLLVSSIIFLTTQLIVRYTAPTYTTDILSQLYNQWHTIAANIEKLNQTEKQLSSKSSSDINKQSLRDIYGSLSSLKLQRDALIERMEKEYAHYRQQQEIAHEKQQATAFYSCAALSLLALLFGIIAQVTAFNIGFITGGLLSLVLSYFIYYTSIPPLVALLVLIAILVTLFMLYYTPSDKPELPSY